MKSKKTLKDVFGIFKKKNSLIKIRKKQWSRKDEFARGDKRGK